MGVTCVFRWKDANGYQSLNYIQDRITKSLQGRPLGRWSVTWKVYRDTNPAVRAGTGKLLHQVAFSQRPRYLCCMVDGGPLVEAEREMETVLLKLKNLWVLRQAAQIEGTSYVVGDFIVRAANVLIGSSYKGVIIEIEYLPCYLCSSNASTPILLEFISKITPPGAQFSYGVDINYSEAGLSEEEFSTAHTGYQYISLFKKDILQ
ncbi:uncharacterized protein VTP21DRAFT_6496 [Calcarisporiella thermophila]|uniref:uncharacterized protein n=1 Tax=Calcarisporiella thermophila TaxID=911321 RepID=UPI003741EDC0